MPANRNATTFQLQGTDVPRPNLFMANASHQAIPVSTVPPPRPFWAPPPVDVRDGVLVVRCLDRAVSEAMKQVEFWVTDANDEVGPDTAGVAGAELTLAEAMLDLDPSRRIQLHTLKQLARGLVRAHTAILCPHSPCGCYQDHFGLGNLLLPAIEGSRHQSNIFPAAEFLLNGFYQLTGHTDLIVGVMHIPDNRPPSALGCTRAYTAEMIAA